MGTEFRLVSCFVDIVALSSGSNQTASGGATLATALKYSPNTEVRLMGRLTYHAARKELCWDFINDYWLNLDVKLRNKV